MYSTVVLTLTLTVGQTELSDKSYAALRTQIVPPEQELRWRAVPWRPTIWQGLRDAVREEKPILLYAMNGHPCGCV